MSRLTKFFQKVFKWFSKSKIVRTKPYSEFLPKWFWNNRWSFLYCFCSALFWASVVVWNNKERIDFSKLFNDSPKHETKIGPLSDALSKNFKKEQLTSKSKSTTLK